MNGAGDTTSSQAPKFIARPPRRAALRVALIYVAFGTLWILFSDFVLESICGDATIKRLHLQTIKGWFFILVTGGMLYFLIRRMVTAFRVTETARQETETRSRTMVERVRDYAIFTLDDAGNVTSWNRGAQQITDWPEAEIIGKSFEEFYAPEDRAAGEPARDLARARAEGWIEEERERVRQDGSKFWANVQITREGDGFLIVLRDVTERRRSQAALQELNERLGTIIENSPLSIITLDSQGRVLSWNSAATRLWGFSLLEVLGKRLPIVPQDRLPQFEQNNSLMLMGRRVEGMAVTGVHRDGRRIDVDLWGSPLRDVEGRVIGSVRVYADVTERKRAEMEIRQLNETLERRVAERTAQLAEVNEELSAFSYTVSHDLRLPLRSLQQMAQELLTTQGEKLDEQGRSRALRIVGAAARMERLIEDLLEYARLTRSELKLERVSLVLVVHELLGRLERDPAYRDAQIIVAEPLGWVRAHQLILQHVILNLLTNAITHVAPGVRPAVRIWAENRDGRVRLCVQDNAVGMSAERREKLFETADGCGIGLTVVRRGIQRMGGKVSVEAAAGGGSRFWIELTAA